MKKAEAYWPLILLLAVIKFVLPLFLSHPVYELQRDEFLYYQQGVHPAWGYLENPPITGWLAMISSWFGGGPAWIKLWPCLFGSATLVVTCLIAVELGGGLFAQFLAGFSILCGAFLRVHYLFQPNFLDIFFGTLAIYFLVKHINDRRPRWIYCMALSLAIGIMGKYSVLFVAAGIGAGILLTPLREILFKKDIWIAKAIGLLIILPNILWQFAHHWPLFHHMQELRNTQLKFNDRTGFIKDQLLMLLPVVFVWITGLIWTIRHARWRILSIVYFTVILLLVLAAGKAYYALAVYPMLLAAGAVGIESATQKRQWPRYVLSGVSVLLMLVLLPLLLPVWKPERLADFYKRRKLEKTGVLKWEDQKNHLLPQDFADMLGWKELAAKTENLFEAIPAAARKETIVYCRNYGQAGALTYYGKDPEFRNKVTSTNGSFMLWLDPGKSFSHFILVDETQVADADPLTYSFRNKTVVDSVTNPYSRQFGNKIVLFTNIDSLSMHHALRILEERKQRF